MRGMQRISTAGIARRGSKYLLALRKPGTSIGESWEFPGGKARFGEPPEEALKREFFEEFQIHILVGRMIFHGSFSNRGTDYELQAFDIKILGDGFTLAEHQKIGWFTLDEMIRLSMADSDRSILEFLRNKPVTI